VNVGSDSSIDDIFTKTLSFWLNVSDYDDGTDDAHIINKGDTWFIAFDADNDRIIYGQGFATSNGRWSIPISNIPLGEWSNLIITYDSSSTSNDPVFYVNGVSVSVTEYSTPEGSLTSDASSNLYLGDSTGASRSYGGVMDSVSIYSRALTSSEILSNYQSGNIEMRYRTSDDGSTWSDWYGGTEESVEDFNNEYLYDTDDSGLVAYYPMDESSGT